MFFKRSTCSGLSGFGESMTQQSDLPQSDIHNIIKQFERTGVLNHDAKYQGTYGDFGSMPEYKEAQDLIAEAKSMFNELPATLRAEHGNDPALFLNWIQNPKNRDDIIDKGFSTEHLPDISPQVERALSGKTSQDDKSDSSPDPE